MLTKDKRDGSVTDNVKPVLLSYLLIYFFFIFFKCGSKFIMA